MDGIPTAKSKGDEFWPILGQVKHLGVKQLFMIGLYSGPSKPDDANEFLRKFDLEAIDLINHGFNYKVKNIKLL